HISHIIAEHVGSDYTSSQPIALQWINYVNLLALFNECANLVSRLVAWGKLRPSFSMMLTKALPTITPSAPAWIIRLTCSGFEIPNPAAKGRCRLSASQVLHCRTKVRTSGATLFLAPVTPYREIK